MSKKDTKRFCRNCGCPGGVEPHYCPHCRETHPRVSWKDYLQFQDEQVIEEKKPVKVIDKSSKIGIPFARKDKMKKHMDWSLGQEITSKSQRDKLDAEHGMIRVSPQEEYRNKDKPRVKGRAVTYAGQKEHTSSAERGGVRTKEGQLII